MENHQPRQRPHYTAQCRTSRSFIPHPPSSVQRLYSGQHNHIKGSANWSVLHAAIAKSIHEGTFFDRKYLVRHSGNGSALKAIYFSSMIAVNGLGVCEPGRTNASVYVAERASKVSHAPAAKALQRKILRGRTMPRVTVKETPLEPVRVGQCPNKTAGVWTGAEDTRFSPQEHLLRECVPSSSDP